MFDGLAPASLATIDWLVIAAYAIGLVALGWLAKTRPERVRSFGSILGSSVATDQSTALRDGGAPSA